MDEQLTVEKILELDNTELDVVLAIKEKGPVRTSSINKEFVHYRFMDKTGDIKGVHFSNNIISEAETLLKDGDVCKIRGKINTYNNIKQIKIKRIQKTTNYNEEDFVKTADIDIDETMDHIHNIIDNLEDNEYQNILKAFFDDPDFVELYKTATAAKFFHHSYRGGLLQHSFEVLEMCRTLTKLYPVLDKSLLYAGALLHDIGKIEAYSTSIPYNITEKGRLLDHIYISAEKIKERSKDILISDEKLTQLLHIILSHHGPKANGWGSTVDPLSKEAIAVHYADDLSSKIAKEK